MTSQPSSTGSEPGDPGTYLELYKLAVEMADRVSARRTSANNFFLALHAAMVTVVGLIGSAQTRPDAAGTPHSALPIFLTAAGGIALSAAWWLALRSYRDLNRAKWAVITDMESNLPRRVFGDEWDSLKRDDLSWWRGRYAEQGAVERVVPTIFAALYAVALVLAIWQP